MPFEAFLSETHARPPRASAFGFLASIAMHGPPITIFVTTWLTHATLIGSSGLSEAAQPRRGTFYIPISLYGEGPGNGGEAGSPLAASAGSRARAGLPGRSGRAGRRGLVAPREIKRHSPKTTWDDPFMLGSYASTSPRGSFGRDEGHGDDQPGSGVGSGQTGEGTGGAAPSGGAGNGMIAATLVDRSKAKDKAAEKKSAGNCSKTGKAQGADGADDYAVGTDLDIVLDDGRAMKAAYISQDSAAYYRTYDELPRLHDAYWPPGRREWAMLFRICISIEGTVSTVAVLKSANVEIDRVLSNAIQSWRYRPRVVDGAARPFCHPIRFIYSRG
jgi:hypothetical protein